MNTISAYIREQRFRLALVRLCRLANQLDAEGLKPLLRWETLHKGRAEKKAIDKPAVKEAINTLEDTADRAPPEEELAAKIGSDPLAWLQALDHICHLDYVPGSFAKPLKLTDIDAEFWLMPRLPQAAASARKTQFGNLEHWLSHHRVVPTRLNSGLTVDWPGLPHGSADTLSRHLRKPTLKVAIAQLHDGVDIEVAPTPPSHFRVTGLSDEETRYNSVLSILEAAHCKQADILVLPELTITNTLRRRIADLLFDQEDLAEKPFAIPLIVLGSFHEPSAERWRNHSQLVSGLTGDRLLSCDKRCPVSYCPPPGTSPLSETLSTAPTPFSVLDTPLGLIALAICKDLFDGAVSQALDELGPDWILVPSMSDSLAPHHDASDRRRKVAGCRVAVANQPMPGGSAAHGFVLYGKSVFDDGCTDDSQSLHVFELHEDTRAKLEVLPGGKSGKAPKT